MPSGDVQPSSTVPTIRQACGVLEEMAPLGLAQSWDNVGLLAGDPSSELHRVLLCIDLTGAVVDEAIAGNFDLVVAYHPPIFKPISRLCADSAGNEALVFRCIRGGVAIYSTHTALDAAQGGTNDVLADLCGIESTSPIETVDQPGCDRCKIVTFIPAEHVDRLAQAMAKAGAGIIGDYTHCSFRVTGKGTFLGGSSTRPAVGKRGSLECVDEIRFETVVDTCDVSAVVSALREAHPYEEPALDIYPLKPSPVRGIGRCGELPKAITLMQLARDLKDATEAKCVQIVGDADRDITRVIIVAGAAGSLPFKARTDKHTAVISGEIRHHDALTIQRMGLSAIALNHWTSEHPVLRSVASRLANALPGAVVELSTADAEPFTPI